ncbi:MAG: tripeptidyl-peptidase Serine peptidase family [Mycobacterium sp.]|nr:tripeptidyl-peptidase Serine peptidase family [Mycobacterium sp.]
MEAWSLVNVRRAAFAATAVMLLVAGCTSLVDGRAVLGAPRPGTPVQWSKCAPASPNVPVPAGAECGLLSVPVDYSKPDGDVAQIAMVRFKATGEKIGSLVINPGGPGESGVDAAVDLVGSMPASVRERFDLVGFDPRGVARSKPAVRCNSDQENDKLRAEPDVDYSPEGVAHIESEAKDLAARCVDKMGKEFLANVGTASVAKDLDAMRAALGDDKLTFVGYSYGTRIGSAYAEAYPQHVRAMILDGAVDPNADPIESDIRQAAAFQQAFNDFAADCAKGPNCPLGTDPAKAVDVYKGMVDPLVQKPAKTQDPRQLSYPDAVIGTIQALYTPSLWGHLADGLTELGNGKGDTMLALADFYMGRDDQGHYTNSTDAQVAVNCVDEPPVTDRSKVIDEDRRTREAAPFMSYGQFTGDAPLSNCAFWPVPPTSKPHQISVSGLPPVLVVSTTNDPATPYQAGVDLAKELGGSLLTFQGTQHTVVFQGNACVDDVAAKYLVDLVVPPPGAKC